MDFGGENVAELREAFDRRRDLAVIVKQPDMADELAVALALGGEQARALELP